MNDNLFEQLDFGAFQEYIDNDDITDISYTNNGQLWVRSLTQGSLRVENENINNAVVEKLAFQCSNVMGVSFNNANPFLDAESPELRMNFVHDSIATNGIALVIRKTPAKIRLKEETLLEEDYVTKDIHDFLIKCVHGHCNIIVCGETGSGKTEFVKYLASHTVESEKLITIEDTLELHLDKIYPHRDIVAMKTNNIASYSDVLVTCMRQNPKWILLSEVRSAEAVSAVRNSISSGHNILSTIHSDKANAIPHRMYSLMETDLDVDQFLNTIYRYVQLGVHIKAYYSAKYKKFHREIDEITEFYIDEDNKPVYNIIYQKTMSGKIVKKNPSQHLLDYLAAQNIDISDTSFETPEDSGLSLNDVIGEKDEAQVIKEQQEKELERKAQEEEQKQKDSSTDNVPFSQTEIPSSPAPVPTEPVVLPTPSGGENPQNVPEQADRKPVSIPPRPNAPEPAPVASAPLPNSAFFNQGQQVAPSSIPQPEGLSRENVNPMNAGSIVPNSVSSLPPRSDLETNLTQVSQPNSVTPPNVQAPVPPTAPVTPQASVTPVGGNQNGNTTSIQGNFAQNPTMQTTMANGIPIISFVSPGESSSDTNN